MNNKIYPILFITILLAVTGCETTSKTTLPPLRIQSATVEELTAKINKSSENFATLKSNMEVRFRDGANQSTRECQGLLAFEEPSKIYLKGYRPLIPTFFTLVSKEGEFWVHLPKDNMVLTGSVSQLNSSQNLQMGIRPDDLLRALNIQPIPPSDTHSVEMQTMATHYLLSVFRVSGTDKFLERQIWVERYHLNPEREIFYNEYGVVEVDITKKKYVNEGYVYMPQEIVIYRPDRGSTLFLSSNKMDINTPLKQELFDFKMPPGAEIEELAKE